MLSGIVLLALNLYAVPTAPVPIFARPSKLLAGCNMSRFPLQPTHSLAFLPAPEPALLCGGAAPETAAPLIRRLNLLGLVIFTIGGLFFGSIWAHHSWGRFWAWDPKETWAFITWCAFLAILHFDHRRELPRENSPQRHLRLSPYLIFTYVGVNIFFAGLHSYAALEVSP